MTDAHLKYMESQIMTATPERLVLIMYDAAIRFINQAKADLRAGQRDGANENLCKAQAIIAELMSSIDFDCGEISLGLFGLYQFFYEKLIEANINNDNEILDQVSPLIEDLRTAWRESQFKTGNDEPAPAGSSFSAVQ